jgi:hypothetical protein
LRDLAQSQVCPRDPGLLQPWIPGTRPGTSPGIPSKDEWAVKQGIQVKFLCFFEAVHELFMNVQMLFKFHGNIQIFLIIFELVLEVFMNCSNFLNCS